ncbi:MAG: tRNA 2-selenouridine(34) synthase MnmH, partial [Caulobacteraceae bacterium]
SGLVFEIIPALDAATLARFDEIIDVRSPREFSQDHVPGAVNLPVLGDAERAMIGTIYVQDSRFKARRLGAALVSRNIAAHLEGVLAGKPGGWAPLVYCWRGGQRSNAFATVIDQVGWRVAVLAGGYRTYRRGVTAALYDAEPDLRLVLLDGYTGSAKTGILGRLAARGVQTLDLEGLADHRGSLFGGFAGRPQPGQKLFESRLAGALAALDPARPIVVEAESSKVGERMVPPMLWRAMRAAPRIDLIAPRVERARYLVEAYGDIVADPAHVEEVLAKLPGRHGRKRLTEWLEMARAGDVLALAESLVEAHYDPAYERSRGREERPRLGLVAVDDLSPASQERAAEAIAGLVHGWAPPPRNPHD